MAPYLPLPQHDSPTNLTNATALEPPNKTHHWTKYGLWAVFALSALNILLMGGNILITRELALAIKEVTVPLDASALPPADQYDGLPSKSREISKVNLVVEELF